MDLTGSKSWEEACTRFPEETKRSCLEKFLSYQLRSIPEELRCFCKSLLREPVGHFKGLMRSSGAFIPSVTIDEDIIREKVPQFSGVDLVILDKPEAWDEAEITMCLATVTGVNLNYGHEEFSVAVLSSTSDMAMVAKAIRETRHFQAPMEAFYAMPNAVKSPTLTKCVHGVTVARSLAFPRNQSLIWTDGTSQNFLQVAQVQFYEHDDEVVDLHQKPVAIYTELVKALTSPGQLVFDLFCGTGTGLVASLREGRSVIGFDENEEMTNHITMRVTKEVGLFTQHQQEHVENQEDEESSQEVLEDGQQTAEVGENEVIES